MSVTQWDMSWKEMALTVSASDREYMLRYGSNNGPASGTMGGQSI